MDSSSSQGRSPEDECSQGVRPPPPLPNPGRWHEIVPPPGAWRKDGACHNQPHLTAQYFYPPGEVDKGWQDPSVIGAGTQAKALCDTCPVEQPCLEYAMATNQPFGVWGGKDARQRRAMRRGWLRQRERTARTGTR